MNRFNVKTITATTEAPLVRLEMIMHIGKHIDDIPRGWNKKWIYSTFKTQKEQTAQTVFKMIS